ncbi:REVERSIBLY GLYCOSYLATED POLYPEPTIDE 3 family protein [Hibiscus syriacus]|uniref:REVERSIBLY GLYCOSYLATED POLYPEPTIDE 3 family protein n=1 Tax=Hibiscus syriacus TaxID=106335 RepID=A0A6A3ARA5_HIBSY|nr:protein BIG GRAIN 1-like E [Hibiscus syriacus]KAE8705382.1 REVERSIBLY GLYCOSYLATED POLYPEPTIDE 3 family protein [Hibiscus syriacus]
MSVTGVSDPDRMLKKSLHRRNDAGEVDVFEAAQYLSGYNDTVSYNCATFSQKMMGRVSLDVPMTMSNTFPQFAHLVEKQIKDKKYKQPSFPGGRFATFLNSLFNQRGSKKKKSKSTTQSKKDEEESPGGRRRSSISHFRSSSTADTKSFYSSSSSGFRTPPSYAHTPSYKEVRSYLDRKQVGPTKRTALHNAVIGEGKNTKTTDYSWLDEKLKFNNGYSENHKNTGGVRHQKGPNYRDRYPLDEKEIMKFNETDDGADSDSSSDLFELNYDLSIYSSGLPVYETTHMDTIKRGAPIAND